MQRRCMAWSVLAALGLLTLGAGVSVAADVALPIQVIEVAGDPAAGEGKAPPAVAKARTAVPNAGWESVSGPITMREAEPNGTTATANSLAGSSAVVLGTVYPNADFDYYSFAGAAGDRVYAAVQTSFSASASVDSLLILYGTDGTTVIEQDLDDGSFGSTSSSIAGATLPGAGTYYLLVRHNSATSQLRPYYLFFQLRSGAPTAETEPNDAGQVLPAGGWVSGDTSATTDVDIFTFDLAAGDTVFLSLDLDPERDVTEWNGTVGLGPFGGFVLIVNDGGTSTPDSEAFFMTAKDAGPYYAYVAVPAGGTTFGTYHLSVTVFPASNNGLTCTTYTATDVPVTIPDVPGVVTSTITVPGNPRIADLDVAINLTHNLMVDLDVNLVSPAGNDNALFNDIGSSTVGGVTAMNLVVDDEAAVPLGLYTVLSGMHFQPELAYRLSWFDGEDAGGAWTLTIRDDLTANGGTLNAWSITVCEPAPLPQCAAGFEPVTVYSSDFEADDGGFTHSGTLDEWERGLPSLIPITTCASGSNCWKTDLDNTYNASSSQDLLSPTVDLTGLSGPVLVSWAQRYHIESASYDHAWVDFRWADDSNPTRLFEWLGASMNATVGSPSTTINESAGWAVFTADMSAYAGQQTELLFHLDSDSSVQYTGLAVDDVTVTACQVAGVPPNIDVSPLSLGSTQPPNTTTGQVLTIANTGGSDLTWAIGEDLRAPSKLVNWSDNFDSYATGSQMHGQGGWKGWFNDPAGGALTSSAQARSAPNSVAIVGASDLVHEYVATDGLWIYTAWQFVPTAFTGESFFLLMNQYNDAGTTLNWSVQVRFNATQNLVLNDGPAGGTLPLVRNAWVEIRVVIDLVADTQAFYYGNQLLFQGSWSGGMSGGGITSIGAVDLFANGATSVYYDDISLVEHTVACSAFTDIPWLSSSATAGTTPPAGSTPVDVNYNSTGLADGVYTANLCVTSNDPDPGPGNGTDLVVLPVTLTVETPVPSISLVKTVGTTVGVCSPDTAITVAAGTTVYYCYTVTNTGTVTFTTHDLSDDVLGTIFTGLNYTLTPGSSVNTVAAGLSIPYVANSTTTNTGTWTAHDAAGAPTQATAQATVTVQAANPAISLTKTVGTVPGVCAVTDTITVATGTEVYYCYQVENTGGVTFEYHDLVDDQVGTLLDNFPYTLAPGAFGPQVIEPFTVTGPVVNTATWTAVTSLGGYVVDNTIPFSWVDISATGTPLGLTDDGEANIVSPFPFTFYGVTSTDLRVANNGGILFNRTTGDLGTTNATLPNATIGLAMLPFWDDIDSDTGNVYWQVLGTAPNRTLVVEWYNRPHYSNIGSGTFEAILYEGTNVIDFQYLDTDFGNALYNQGISATVGINQDGTVALQYSFNQAVITDNLAIRFQPTTVETASSTDSATVNTSDPDITVNPTSLMSAQLTNTVVTLPLALGNVGTADLTWTLEEEPVSARFPQMTEIPGTGDSSVAHERASEEPEGKLPDWFADPVEWSGPELVLFDNGPLVTHPGGGAGGADASALQTNLAMNTLGAGAQVSAGNRVADDFTITDPSGWDVDTITVFTYQTGSTTTSTINALNVRIWNGPPNDPAAVVVWGDTTTNILTSTTWANMYRVTDTTLTTTNRPIMTAVGAVNTILPAGTYWVDYQIGGTLASGPWVPPVTILGQTTTGNSLQFTTTGWAVLTDTGTLTPQGVPFIVEGQPAICGNLSDVPWLSASPTAGTIAPAGSQQVNVSFDSTGIALGLYNATICLFSNDPDEPVVPVPVTMEVVIPVELQSFSVE